MLILENQNKKIYGIYPGNLDKNRLDEINKLDEIDIWKMIENRGGIIFWANHDHHIFDISPKDLVETQYALEYLVYQTKRFGVEFNEPKEGSHIERSESYNQWYNFWYNFMETMDPNTKEAFIDAKCKGESVEKYLPKESWKEYYDKAKQLEKKISVK